eukprot:CAMPEP_0170602664 /NCGR_PEP_ID=MMETSP0224-20130122/18510_1 /TAXON_ID=285029 /ORGANISM="Togula jolla, Strain CCCM 725" /LENGTH=254 /DNA_ID=CAMNT_0010927515 /DNA_START=46 /DNA_END=810 /DNA_ORIENTATION=+
MAPKGRWQKQKEPKEPKELPVLPVRRIDLDLPDAICVLLENYFTVAECERYMAILRNEIDWRKQQVEVVTRDGVPERKAVEEPRLTLFMSDPGICYAYSGRENVGVGWHPALLEIKRKAEEAIQECGLPPVTFNSVQLNRYDGPRHTLGMHADDEPDLARDQPIASVSFGCTREFRIMKRSDEGSVKTVELADGAFFVMAGGMQRHYLHGVPAGNQTGLRFNLTFRICVPRQARMGSEPLRDRAEAPPVRAEVA